MRVYEKLPEWLCDFTQLEKLDISANELYSIPEFVGKLQNLTELNLGHFRELNLSGNEKMKTLPKSLNKLCNLEIFEVSETPISKVPECIRCYKKIKKLSLGGIYRPSNRIFYTKTDPTSLAIPRWIWELTNLEYLYFGRSVTKIPESIRALKNLRQIDIWDSKIKTLPKSFFELSSLKELSLTEFFINCDNIETLPDTIGGLGKLEKIRLLRFTELESLPDSIGNLKSLKTLYIRGGKVTALPESIGNISSLGGIRLQYTQIASLPVSIGNLTNISALVKIEIVNCAVKTIPPSIQWLVDSGELILIKTEDEFIALQHRHLKRNKPRRS